MTTKQFNRKVEIIVKEMCLEEVKSPTSMVRYGMDTVFGRLEFSPSPSPMIRLYSMFMKFEIWDKEKQKKFEAEYGGFVYPSNPSGKWNIHSYDADECLTEFEERLGNLKYIKENEHN